MYRGLNKAVDNQLNPLSMGRVRQMSQQFSYSRHIFPVRRDPDAPGKRAISLFNKGLALFSLGEED
jgi:hypothetical protein